MLARALRRSLHSLPALPYGAGDLAPILSQRAMELHHGKHLNAYVTKANDLASPTQFAAASVVETIRGTAGASRLFVDSPRERGRC